MAYCPLCEHLASQGAVARSQLWEAGPLKNSRLLPDAGALANPFPYYENASNSGHEGLIFRSPLEI